MALKDNQKIKLMCSYVEKIQLCPHDHQLSYVYGDTNSSPLIGTTSLLCGHKGEFYLQLQHKDLYEVPVSWWGSRCTSFPYWWRCEPMVSHWVGLGKWVECRWVIFLMSSIWWRGRLTRGNVAKLVLQNHYLRTNGRNEPVM